VTRALVFAFAGAGCVVDIPPAADAGVDAATPAVDATPVCPDPTLDLDGDGLCDGEDTDDDGDGISDAEEFGPGPGPIDTDGDGVPDHRDLDSDDDGVKDEFEGLVDVDGDGLPSAHDLDADGDGIADAIEGPAGQDPPNDFDNDGAYDFLDTDSDNDALDDALEDPNGNGVLDPGESSPYDDDTDNDGYPDLVEWIFETDPQDPEDGLSPDDTFVVLPNGAGPETVTAVFTLDTVDPASLIFVVTSDPHHFVQGWMTPVSTSGQVEVAVTFQNTTVSHHPIVAQLFVVWFALLNAAGDEVATDRIGVILPASSSP
jgi:hypothetical protein